MKTAKKYLKVFLNFTKLVFNLANLKDEELDGHFSWKTKLRLLPKTNIRLPFHLGRTVRGCSFSDHLNQDPFSRMVSQVINSKKDDKAIKILKECYREEASNSTGSPMGSLEPEIFSRYPAWAIVMPWEKMSLKDKLMHYPKLFKKNRGLFGFDLNEDFSFKSFYSDEAARSQVKQTRDLFNSIKNNGIIETRKLPLVFILKNKSEWRWCMTGEGNHRAYIYALLNEYSLLAEVYDLVDREKVESWPNVLNGNYTIDEALPIFDSFFEGKKSLRGIA